MQGNPFVTVLFNVPSLWNVVFCTSVAWGCLVCLLLCKEEGSSPVSSKLVRGGIWTYMRCIFKCSFNLFESFLSCVMLLSFCIRSLWFTVSYAANKLTKAIPVIFFPGSHLQCVDLDSTVDLYIIFKVESRPVP